MPKRVSDIVARGRTRLQPLAPYRDIIVFVIALLVADGVWKLWIDGHIYAPFAEWLSAVVAQHTFSLVSLFRDTVHLTGTRLWFDSGSGSTIVFPCTPVKQSFIWLVLIATARGKWLHKLWYIPLGWLLIYGINIVRIAAISLIIEFHPDLFDLFHTYIFKYAFYGCMFLMWVGWLHLPCNKKIT